MDGGKVCKIRYLSMFTPFGLAEQARGRLQGCGKRKEGVRNSRTRSPAPTLVQEHKVHAIHTFIACRTRTCTGSERPVSNLGCSARGYCRKSHTACGSMQLGQSTCPRSTASSACMYLHTCMSGLVMALEPSCHCVETATACPQPLSWINARACATGHLSLNCHLDVSG